MTFDFDPMSFNIFLIQPKIVCKLNLYFHLLCVLHNQD